MTDLNKEAEERYPMGSPQNNYQRGYIEAKRKAYIAGAMSWESLREENERLRLYKEAVMRLIEQLFKTQRIALRGVDISNKNKRILLNANGISSENFEMH